MTAVPMLSVGEELTKLCHTASKSVHLPPDKWNRVLRALNGEWSAKVKGESVLVDTKMLGLPKELKDGEVFVKVLITVQARGDVHRFYAFVINGTMAVWNGKEWEVAHCEECGECSQMKWLFPSKELFDCHWHQLSKVAALFIMEKLTNPEIAAECQVEDEEAEDVLTSCGEGCWEADLRRIKTRKRPLPKCPRLQYV